MDDKIRVSELKNVFIVDDEKNIVRNLEALMRNVKGVIARAFTQPLIAYETAKEVRPDLLIVDMMMPVMDGVTFVRELRKEGIECDVIFLSAEPDLVLKKLIPENRIRKIFPKPYNTAKLLNEVRESLYGKQE